MPEPLLFHFSDNGTIPRFVPRAVLHPSRRAPGQAWLNGPLVWAIDAWHQGLYLFPRDCPRILLWPTAHTTAADKSTHLGSGGARMVAYVEQDWLSRLENAVLYRYQLPATRFQSLADAGMWVSHDSVDVLERKRLDSLDARLAEQDVELRVVNTLTPLQDLWQSSLHVSGIRLRNAKGWPSTGVTTGY